MDADNNSNGAVEADAAEDEERANKKRLKEEQFYDEVDKEEFF